MGFLEEALVRAVKRGDLEGVRSALEAGADPRTQATRRRLPPLHLAAQQGHAHVVKYLLDHGFAVDSPHPAGTLADGVYRQMTPLHFAAEKGRTEAVRVLLGAGADPNRPAPGFFNYRPLHMTVWWELTPGLVETAALLLEYGADPALRDDRGKTAWDLASEREETELVQEFLQLQQRHSTSPVSPASGKMPSPPPAAESRVPFPLSAAASSAGRKLRDDLSRAAEKGDVTVFEAARSAGVDFHQPVTDKGDTPLMLAAGEGHDALVEFLIREGADLNTARPDGTTALHTAVRREKNSTVGLLLHHGASPSRADDSGLQPLHLAARSPSPAARTIARLLVAHGAPINQLSGDPDHWSNRSGTPLHIAAAEGHAPMATLLVILGADPNAFNALGQTPSLAAIASLRWMNHPAGHPAESLQQERICQVLEELLVRGADINLPHEVTGWTPLHEAARRDASLVMRFLLSHGADPNISDRHGRLAVHHLLDGETLAARLQALELDAKPQQRARAEAELRRQKNVMYHLLREFGSQV